MMRIALMLCTTNVTKAHQFRCRTNGPDAVKQTSLTFPRWNFHDRRGLERGLERTWLGQVPFTAPASFAVALGESSCVSFPMNVGLMNVGPTRRAVRHSPTARAS